MPHPYSDLDKKAGRTVFGFTDSAGINPDRKPDPVTWSKVNGILGANWPPEAHSVSIIVKWLTSFKPFEIKIGTYARSNI